MFITVKMYLVLNFHKLKNINYKLYKKFLELVYRNYNIISVPVALGETTLTCMMIKELKKKCSGKVAIVVHNRSKAAYVKHYEDVDKAIIAPYEFINYMKDQTYEFNHIKKGKIFNVVKGYPNIKPYYPVVEDFVQYYKNLMNLGGEYPSSVLVKDYARISKLIKKYKLKNPSILLSPDSNSLNNTIISYKFWENLALKLQQMGYQVLINSCDKNYGNYKYIFENLYDTVLIASEVSYIIGFRSGILDTFAPNINTPIICLYPTPDFQVYKYRTNSSMKTFFGVKTDEELNTAVIYGQSLSHMFKTKNILEICIDKNNINNLDENIISYIANKRITNTKQSASC